MPSRSDFATAAGGRFRFAIQARDPGSGARAGVITTAAGEVPTPVFMPVGSRGAVKAMTAQALWDSGARLILGNTYHLYLRPGHELIAALGGLHRFEGWPGSILTDSAGFQVLSLASLAKVSSAGVEFRSHLDGSRHFFSPEMSMDVQLALGADIIMTLDHCVPFDMDPAGVEAAVATTTSWARRCRHVWMPQRLRDGRERALFGIVQGGVSEPLRRRSTADLVALDLPGYAIGGLSVGEPPSAMREMTELVATLLPPDRPRYLMGVGFPDDILEGVLRGVDMFDCVLPTRMARTGTVLTWDGRLVVKNSQFARDENPVDRDCDCPTCQRHSRAYLRHLFASREITAPVLATVHNLHFYQTLMRSIRLAIAAGNLAAFARQASERWRAGERARQREIRRGSG